MCLLILDFPYKDKELFVSNNNKKIFYLNIYFNQGYRVGCLHETRLAIYLDKNLYILSKKCFSKYSQIIFKSPFVS